MVPAGVAEALPGWAKDRGVIRVRSDRKIGQPDDERIIVWGQICERRGISVTADGYAVLDLAKAFVDWKREPWQAWKYLDLQIGIAAESYRPAPAVPVSCPAICEASDLDDDPEWAQVKALVRQRISEIAFQNWFADSWQLERRGDTLEIGVPDVPTREFLNTQYSGLVQETLAALDIGRIAGRREARDRAYVQELKTNVEGARTALFDGELLGMGGRLALRLPQTTSENRAVPARRWRGLQYHESSWPKRIDGGQ